MAPVATTINSQLPAFGAADFSALRQKLAERGFHEADADQSGSISKDEFVRRASTEQSAPQTHKAPAGSFGTQHPEELFKKADQNGDNVLSREEFAQVLAKLASHFGAPSAPPPMALMVTPIEGAGGGATASVQKEKEEAPVTEAAARGQDVQTGDARPADAKSIYEIPGDEDRSGKVTLSEHISFNLQQAVDHYASTASVSLNTNTTGTLINRLS